MTPLAPHLTAFLRDRLPRERGASPHTCDAYAYAFQLLLGFAAQRLKRRPSALTLEQIDAPLVLSFLNDLESKRGNSARSRNARLAAIRSFARFVEYRAPSCMQQIRALLAIPMKKTDEKLVSYLTHHEVQAILDAPDPSSRDGVRDRAMLHVAFAAGLRVSELVGLRLDDVLLQPQPAIHVRGKGRRERTLPLWKATVKALRAWLALRGHAACPELFLNARRAPLTRDGFEYILAKHAAVAAVSVPRSRRSECPRMSCGTAAPCTPSRRRTTSARSPCGLGTPACRPPRSTFAQIRPRSSKPPMLSCHPLSGEADFGRLTSCSHPCAFRRDRPRDYAVTRLVFLLDAEHRALQVSA
jgi:integrase/recombinase XerD